MSSHDPNSNGTPKASAPDFVGAAAVPAPRLNGELGALPLSEQVSALSEEVFTLRALLAVRDQQLAESEQKLTESEQRIGSLSQRLEESYVHPVMGIPNRIWFEEFSNSIENPTVGREKPINLSTHLLVFGVIDVDGLKPVNDTYGHDAGDQLLHGIAQSVRGSIREINNDKIFQLGGDEIGVAIPIAKDKITDETPLGAIIDKIKQRISSELAENIRTGDMAPEVKAEAAGVSMGFSPYTPGEPVKDAVVRADTAMYTDKQARKEVRKYSAQAAAAIGGVVFSPQGDSILE